MLRSIVAMCGVLAPLPPKRQVLIRLYYTDDTPVDYQPPGFADSTGQAVPSKWDKAPMAVQVGSIATGYHCLQVQVQTREDLDGSAPVLQEDDLLAPIGGVPLDSKGEAKAAPVDDDDAPATDDVDIVRRHVCKTGDARLLVGTRMSACRTIAWSLLLLMCC